MLKRISTALVGAMLMVGLFAVPAQASHYNNNASMHWHNGTPYACTRISTNMLYSTIKSAMNYWKNADGARVIDEADYAGTGCTSNIPMVIEVTKVNWGCDDNGNGIEGDGTYGSYYRTVWMNYGAIRLNQDCLRLINSTQRHHVIRHEFGHAMGLAHNSYDDGVMNPGWPWNVRANFHERVSFCDLWNTDIQCYSVDNWD